MARSRSSGRAIVERSAREIRVSGLAHVPGDRMARGVDRHASIACKHPDGTAGPGALVTPRHHFADLPRQQTAALIKRFDIRAPRTRTRP